MMSTHYESAKRFFDACDTSIGWDGCEASCHSDATFSSQTSALSDISSLEGYCEWMKNLLTPIPDGHYELKFLGVDDTTNSAAVFAVFHGTQSGPGGPVPPTGKTLAADYVYHMAFDGDRIKHMTKIWNDTISMQQLGWA
jgi:predicted ester cyclase